MNSSSTTTEDSFSSSTTLNPGKTPGTVQVALALMCLQLATRGLWLDNQIFLNLFECKIQVLRYHLKKLTALNFKVGIFKFLKISF